MATMLVSCHFTEEIHIAADGSGKVSFTFDGAEVLAMAGDQFPGSKEEAVDTVMVFKDFLERYQDSISKLSAVEQARLKKLEHFKMHMVVDSEAQAMNMDFYGDFKDVTALNDLFVDFQTATALGGQQVSKGVAPAVTKEPTEVVYAYTNNTFRRKTNILDTVQLQKRIDSLSQMRMFLASSTYELKYRFPKKIKKTSNPKALFGQDGKSLTLQVGLLDFMKEPTVLDIEVVLDN